MDCPSCGKEIGATMEEVDIPHSGATIITTYKCAHCGYKRSDVWHVEEREGTRLTFEFSGESDLSVRVVKSARATVRIPELGIEVKPGPASEGYISNVEGVLERMEDAMAGMKELLPKKDGKLRELVSKINWFRQGKGGFTLVIEDPSGNSAIVSKKTKEEKLTRGG